MAAHGEDLPATRDTALSRLGEPRGLLIGGIAAGVGGGLAGGVGEGVGGAATGGVPATAGAATVATRGAGVGDGDAVTGVPVAET